MPSKSQKQHDMMVAGCKNPEFAKKLGIDQSVCCEFAEADRKAGLWQDKKESSSLGTDLDLMHDFLERAAPRVQKNVSIVESSELKYPYLLHVNGDKNPKYIPRIGFRQADDEDRTTPRITAAPTLVGCLIGYSMLYWNFIEAAVTDKNSNIVDWKGGVYLYKLPFKVALKPNSKLVYDQVATDEHWLVSYKPGEVEYPRERIGKLVIAAINSIAVDAAKRDHTFELFLELNENISLNNSTSLEPGYYHILYTENRNVTWRTKDSCQVTKISKEDFLEKKRVVADRLSIQNPSILRKW